LSFDQVYIQHNQPQDLSPNSHLTVDTIDQTQDAVNVLWIRRHYSRHAAWPTVIEIHENSLENPGVISTNSDQMNKNKRQILTNIYWTDHIQYRQLTPCAPQFA